MYAPVYENAPVTALAFGELPMRVGDATGDVRGLGLCRARARASGTQWA